MTGLLPKQTQKVASDAIAVQSGGDTNIVVGMTAIEVRNIIHSAIEVVMPLFASQAREIANERMADLEHRVMERLASQTQTSAEALRQPDFQYALTRAHYGYARSGDAQVADTLVDLIGHRAAQTERNRLSLTLNDAIDKTALLTKNEFAELSLIYILRYTRSLRVNNFPSFVDWLINWVEPFIDDIAEHDAAYQYLEAQSCGQIDEFGAKFKDLFVNNYGGVLSKGFDQDQIKSVLNGKNLELLSDREMIVPCLLNEQKLQFNAVAKDVFLDRAKNKTDHETALKLWELFEVTFLTEEELVAKIAAKFAKFRRLQLLWNSTPLKSFRLNAVGIAIGHANARRVVKFDGELSTWIK